MAGLPGCSREQKDKPAAPASTTKSEGDLAYVNLPEKDLDEKKATKEIEIGPATTQEEQEFAEFTGWITIPQGREVTLTAPVAGYLRQAESGQSIPIVGRPVKPEQELFRLEPVLTPVEELQMKALKRDVDSDLAKATASEKFAKADLERVQHLHKQGLKGEQDVDKAKERLDHAHESLEAAKDKQKLFVTSQPISIESPLAGTVLTVHANPGEFVAKSAPLITIANLDKFWVRVPIPEYEMLTFKDDKSVTILLRGNKGLSKKKADPANLGYTGKFIAKVPRVDVQRHTIDLIYELAPGPSNDIAKQMANTNGNDKGKQPKLGPKLKGKVQPASEPLPLAKDQMVSVLVPLGKKSTATVVPYSAIVFDSQGGAWIYLYHGEKKHNIHQFERRRVELGPPVNGDIVIRPPLPAETKIVTRGAAMLFSSEFHSAPGAAPAVDDDD
jgi:multidrug efflux pump subunit AcrA (membrane-fusion protein)